MARARGRRGGGYDELGWARAALEGETALRSELFSDRRRGADRWSGARLRRNALSSRDPTDYIPQSYRCGTRLGLANMIYFIKIGAKTWDPGAVPASALSLVGFFGGRAGPCRTLGWPFAAQRMIRGGKALPDCVLMLTVHGFCLELVGKKVSSISPLVLICLLR